MELQNIRTFLEIARTRNITRTANNLFVTQSAVSKSLKSLEDEVGYALVERGRGKREVQLTSMGLKFLPIAERWMALSVETEALKETHQHTLKLAAVESFYFEQLQDFVLAFQEHHPEIRLSIQVKDSTDVCSLLENDIVDYGFSAYSANIPRLEFQEIYHQAWCVIRYAEKPVDAYMISADELDPDKELSFLCGDFDTLSLWREKHMHRLQPGGLEVNGMFVALKLLKERGYWALGTSVYAQNLRSMMPLQVIYLDDPPHPRTIYLASNRTRVKRDIDLCFEKELNRFLLSNGGGI